VLSRAEAQSFDGVAEDYERLAELAGLDRSDAWLSGFLPVAGGRALDLGCGAGRYSVTLAERFEQVDAIDLSGSMIKLARDRRPRPNITYREADLHEIDGAGRYDLVLSVLTLHHVPDLQVALAHIRALVAPGGRAVLMDMYPADRVAFPRRLLRSLVPLRWRLHGLAVQRFMLNCPRRGPAAAWEIYRLSTGAWLDHRVSDRFFSPEQLDTICRSVFPGYERHILGGAGAVAVVWDAPEDGSDPS
jgi:ubiquinone/menaquinone biosynthesis C-methylase UbiE